MKLLTKIMSYWFRAFALLTLFAFLVFVTSRIGQPPSMDVLTWKGAWNVIGSLSMFMLIAFLAGRESKGDK